MTEGQDGSGQDGSGQGGSEQFVDEAGRYRLDSRIATGGMGEVWRGTDTVLGRDVAIKLLKTEYADDATFRSRFETEARHAAALHHPGVAAVFDFGESSATDGSAVARPYLVMELVDGQPLSALLAGGRPLDPDATRDLMAQAADALGAAHVAGIVHRDVKPANLMVTPDRTVKITDFGIARAAEGMALTETGQVMGTPQYLSPEQAQGTSATPASDVYSLGVVAFECLAGRRPFVAESAVATALAHLREPVPDLPDEVPADLGAVVRRAMSKEPEQRFPDGAAFAAALRDPSSVAPVAAAGAAAGAAGAAGADPGEGTLETEVLGAAAVPPAAAHGAPSPAGPDGGGPVGPGRMRWGWVALAVLVIGALVLVAVLASGLGDDPTDPDDPTTSQKPDKPRKSKSDPSSEPTETSAPTESTEPTRSDSPSQTPTTPPTSDSPTETASPTDTASPSETASSPSSTSSPVGQQTPTATSTARPSSKTSPTGSGATEAGGAS